MSAALERWRERAARKGQRLAPPVTPSVPCAPENTQCTYQDPHIHGFSCTRTCPCRTPAGIQPPLT